MSYKNYLEIQITRTQETIEKCEKELLNKYLEKHIRTGWLNVLTEANENLLRLKNTAKVFGLKTA